MPGILVVAMKTLVTMRAVLGGGWLLASLAAQGRAPCRGVVRDAAGAPVAGIEVVCAAAPDFPVFGATDRCRTVTDAEGRFGLDLVVGSAYAVWAIGRGEAGGRRRVVAPSVRAAAGVQLELITEAASFPDKLQVLGTADWIADGPLALRLYLAEGITLGADIPVPGDGPIPLPPLPTDWFAASIVNGKGQPLLLRTIDLAVDRTFSLPRAWEGEVLVVDEDGQPLAGVTLFRYVDAAFAAPALHPLQRIALCSRPPTVVAVTGRDGKARVRLPQPEAGEPAMLLAGMSGRITALSGWIDDERFHNGRGVGAHEDQSLQFTLRPTVGNPLQIAGDGPADRLALQESGVIQFATQRHASGCFAYTESPFEAVGGHLTALVGDVGRSPSATIVGKREQAVPNRFLGLIRRANALAEPFSLDALRTVAVQIVDATGHPAAGAHVGLADADPRRPLQWLVRLAADGEGRAELRVPDHDFVLYAATEQGGGVAFLRKDVAAPTRIVLQPFRTLRIAALDHDSAGCQGARLVPGETIEIQGGTPEQEALARIAVSQTGGTHLRALRTDRRGETTIRFLPTASKVGLQVLHAGRRSASFALVAQEGVLSVVVD